MNILNVKHFFFHLDFLLFVGFWCLSDFDRGIQSRTQIYMFELNICFTWTVEDKRWLTTAAWSVAVTTKL